MSNPLSMFRRHQKVLLAVFGVLIMITFTVGGVITQLQPRHTGGSGASDVVLTWKHGKVSEQDMAYMRDMHNLTVRFLDRLILATIDANGTPKGPGLTRDQRGSIIDPGIPRSFAEGDLAQTMLLAQKARDMGMTISEEAIFDFLDTLSDDVLPRTQYGQILDDATGGRVGRLQLFEQLGTELLAQNMRVMASSGTFAMSPDRAWDYFNRMNRRIKAEILPLRVDDYKSKVSGEPGQAEIEQLYEEGKDRYPNPDSPEPGFRRRRKIAFEYLKADYGKFLETAMAAVTDEEIAEYYEDNKSDFTAIELPPETDDETTPQGDGGAEPDGGAAGPDADSAEPAGDTSEPDAGTTESDADVPPTEPESPAGGSDADAEEAAKPKRAAEEAEEAEMSSPEQPESSDAGDAAAEAPDAGEEESGPELQPPSNPSPEADQPEPPAESDQSYDLPKGSFAEATFVSFNAQEGVDAGEDEPDQTTDEETEEPPTDPPADDATETDEESTPEPPEMPADDTASQDDEAAAGPDTTPMEAEEAAAEDQPEAKPETDAAEDSDDSVEKEVKYKPLEEVADEIRRNLAHDPADKAMKSALQDARNDIQKYVTQQAKYEALFEENPELKKPVPPDPKDLAKKYGLEAGSTELLDELEIAETELGQAYRFDMSQGRFNQIPFAQIAYTSGHPLYKADQIRSLADITFLYWKVDEKEPFVPELEDIREEVVDAWTQQKAFGLARSDAESLANDLPGDKSLKDSLGEQRAKDVVETGEFSWMTQGAVPTGFGMPMLSSVDGVQSAGPEFMESVFSLDVDELGVAANRPQSEVYVVRVVSEEPSEELRRQQFLESGMSFATFHIAIAERQRFLERWNGDLEKEMEVTWNRQPLDGAEY